MEYILIGAFAFMFVTLVIHVALLRHEIVTLKGHEKRKDESNTNAVKIIVEVGTYDIRELRAISENLSRIHGANHALFMLATDKVYYRMIELGMEDLQNGNL